MLQPRRQLPINGQLSVLTALIALGYTLARFLDLPTRLVETTVLGSPIAFHVNGQTIALLLVSAIITSGSDTLIRSHPRLQLDAGHVHPAIHWIMPGFAALAVGMMLTVPPMGPAWWLGLALGVTCLTLLLIAEYAVVDPIEGGFPAARLCITMLAYLTMLSLLSWLLRNVAQVAPLTVLIAGLIAFRLLVLHGASYRQAGINGLVVGLVLAECAWVLGNWAIPPLVSALVLLTVLHLITGLIQHSLSQSLPQRTLLLEYGVVGVIALGFLLGVTLRD